MQSQCHTLLFLIRLQAAKPGLPYEQIQQTYYTGVMFVLLPFENDRSKTSSNSEFEILVPVSFTVKKIFSSLLCLFTINNPTKICVICNNSYAMKNTTTKTCHSWKITKLTNKWDMEMLHLYNMNKFCRSFSLITWKQKFWKIIYKSINWKILEKRSAPITDVICGTKMMKWKLKTYWYVH